MLFHGACISLVSEHALENAKLKVLCCGIGLADSAGPIPTSINLDPGYSLEVLCVVIVLE